MRKNLFWLLLLGFAAWTGCESNTDMCKQDSECYSLCVTYSKTNMLYACTDGQCKCVNEEELSCDADEEVAEGDKPHCEKFCDALRPGTKGVCNSGACECRTSTGENEVEEKKQCQKDEECYALCYTLGQTSLYGCSNNQCLCAGEDKVSCKADEEVGEGELSYCQLLCNTLKPGTKGVCADSHCSCQKE